MPSLFKRSILRADPPVTPVVDTTDLTDMTDVELRARLGALDLQRRELAGRHTDKIAPMVAERERLVQKLAEVDEALAYEGIQRQDHERVLDRQVMAVQAELHGRAVPVVLEDVDVDVDQRQVDRLLNDMLSGRVSRNTVMPSDDAMIEACREYDGLEAQAIEWVRHVARTRAVTGQTPVKPESAERFSDDALREIAQRQGIRL